MSKHLHTRKITLGLAMFALIGAAFFGVQAWDGDHSPTRAESAAATADDPTPAAGDEAQAFDGTSDIVLGQADAPITVIEYASMTCSHCAEFHTNVFPEFKKHYIESGRAKFVMRHFVLNGPDLAASMIARCAPQDRYYALIDLFLKRQNVWMPRWQALGQPAPDATLADLAIKADMDDFVRPAGITSSRVKECLDNEGLRNDLLKMRGAGQQEFNITGTPTLIINGKVYDGEQTFAAFDKALRAAE